MKYNKLTSKREIVTTLLENNCFDYFFQVLFVNVTVWILFWLLTLFSTLDFSVNTTHPKILRQSRLKMKLKFFFEKITGPWIIQLYDPMGYKIFLENFQNPQFYKAINWNF